MTVNSDFSLTYILQGARIGLCALYELLRMEFSRASQHFQRRSNFRWFVLAHTADASKRVRRRTVACDCPVPSQARRLFDFCGSVMQ
jgi:hypothetical protein